MCEIGYLRKPFSLLLHRCFVSAPWPMIGGIALPMTIMVIFNSVVYVMIIRRISKRVPGKTYSKEQLNHERRKRVQNAISIFLLLGLTWGLGYFCFIPAGSVPSFIFQMIFVTFNSGQGYLLFMVYAMRNPTFRKKWRQMFVCCPDEPLTSSFALSSSTGKRHQRKSINFSPLAVPISGVESRRINILSD